MTQVMLGGAGFADIWVDFAVIWGFIVAFFAISALRFRKKHASKRLLKAALQQAG